MRYSHSDISYSSCSFSKPDCNISYSCCNSKAVRFYEQAQSLLNIWYAKTQESIYIDIYTLLEASIVSNMAQIYRDNFLNLKISEKLILNLNAIVVVWEAEYIDDETIPECYFYHFASHVQLSHHVTIQGAPCA
jgi:hypothetical protein